MKKTCSLCAGKRPDTNNVILITHNTGIARSRCKDTWLRDIYCDDTLDFSSRSYPRAVFIYGVTRTQLQLESINCTILWHGNAFKTRKVKFLIKGLSRILSCAPQRIRPRESRNITRYRRDNDSAGSANKRWTISLHPLPCPILTPPTLREKFEWN